MAGYCSLSPYGIIVVTERMNVRIIASSTHFALVSEVLFSGILAELFRSVQIALIAEKAEILKPSWVFREMNMRLLNIKGSNELKEIIVTSKFVRDQI